MCQLPRLATSSPDPNSLWLMTCACLQPKMFRSLRLIYSEMYTGHNKMYFLLHNPKVHMVTLKPYPISVSSLQWSCFGEGILVFPFTEKKHQKPITRRVSGFTAVLRARCAG